jgi:hypothetical protein
MSKSALRGIAVILSAYAGLFSFMYWSLGRDWLFSDVPSYWLDSLNWNTPFRDVHVPGYPLTIAAVRFLSLRMVPDMLLMHAINILGLIMCWVGLSRLARPMKLEGGDTLLVGSLFVCWPFVGLTTVVSPLAEVPGMAFFIWAMVYLVEQNIWKSAVLFGFAALYHKGLWPFIGLVLMADLKGPERSARRSLKLFGMAFGPIIFLWVAGTVYNDWNPFWIISKSLSMGASSRHYYLPFEGLWQTLCGDGLKGLIKGLVMVSVIFFLGLLAWRSRILSLEFKWYAFAVVSAALLWFAFLTKLELLAALRFSRLAVIAVVWNVVRIPHRSVLSLRLRQWVWLAAALLYLSQFLSAVQIHRVLLQEGIPPFHAGFSSAGSLPDSPLK